MTTERFGDWSQTFTGRAFWPMDPRAEDVCIEDIAHALALQCRFAGHCREPYSVAEHSVRVAEYIRSRGGGAAEVFAGLMHDSGETYLQDVVRPVKRQPEMRPYRNVELIVQTTINKMFGLPIDAHDWAIVHEADEVLLATEARDLMAKPPADWRLSQPPMAEVIVPWDWRAAEREFLARFYELRGA